MVGADRAQALTVLNKQIGRLCQSSARTARIAVDAAATVGGECFGVIWPRVAITQVDALATRGSSKLLPSSGHTAKCSGRAFVWEAVGAVDRCDVDGHSESCSRPRPAVTLDPNQNIHSHVQARSLSVVALGSIHPCCRQILQVICTSSLITVASAS